MLSISNYNKKYNNHLILSFKQLNLSDGIHLMKGVNGSGKSTLLKSIAGIIPFEGEIKLNQTLSLTNNPVEFRKVVNYADAEPKYPDYLNGFEIISFIAKAKGANKSQLSELCEYFGVTNYFQQAISSYSSGMVKKIALIQAFLGNPKLILLDEPFTTIDKASAEKLIQLIEKKNQEQKINFIIASHQETIDSRFKINTLLEVKEQTVFESIL